MFKTIVIFTSFLEIILSDSLTSFYNIKSPGDTSTEAEFLCISDNIDDAITWNYAVTKTNRILFKDQPSKFNDYSQSDFSTIDVPLSGTDVYNPWQITHSYDNPMGPVYDSRWEDFREYYIENYERVDRTSQRIMYGSQPNLFKKTGALVFSIKGSSMISIFLCVTPNVMKDFCYWLKINSKENMKTVIRRCEHGIPRNSSNCGSQSDSIITPINSQEWKTYVLKWKEKDRKIELYDELKLILSYKDNDYKFYNDSTYYVYFSNPNGEAIIRFHEYEYFYTTKTGSNMERLTSFDNIHWSKDFWEKMCITMLVGLCNHCGLNIKVIDANEKNIQTHTILPHLTVHELPTWEVATFYIKNTSYLVHPIKLELETFSIASEKNSTGHWAIKHFYNCLSKVQIKRKFLKISSEIDSSNVPVWCQRLSYNTSHLEILNSHAPLFAVPKDDFENCPPDRTGPHCEISCSLYFNKGCNSLMKCTSNHCFCNQDHRGCVLRASKMGPPSIAKVTRTSAYAYFKAINEYVENGVIIGFELKANPDDKKIKRYAGRLGKSNNSNDKYYHTTFTNLRPGTEYFVRMYVSYKYEGNKTKTIMGETATFKTLPTIQSALEIPTLVTMVQEGKGKAILSWKSPSYKGDTIIKFLIHEEIITSKLEHKPIFNKKKIMQIPFAKPVSEYVVYLDLLPSTQYRISLQAEAKTGKGNLSTIEINSQSALTFKYDPSAKLDHENSQIKVIIPPVANNTENSMLYIIVKGSPICKQGGALSSNLRKMIELEYNEVAWLAATFCTYKTADKLFIVGDEFIYNDVIANCKLHSGNSYVIYILVRERGDHNELQEFPALLWTSPEIRVSSNTQHWMYWAVPLAVLILILCGIVYRYCKT